MMMSKRTLMVLAKSRWSAEWSGGVFDIAFHEALGSLEVLGQGGRTTANLPESEARGRGEEARRLPQGRGRRSREHRDRPKGIGGATTFLAVTIAAFVILGSVLEGIPAIVLFGPLLFPIAKQVGVHEVHYAMVVVLAMGIGLFAPPFGVGYYAACAISRIHPDQGMKPIIGYMLALLIGTIIVAAIPWISIGFL